MSMEHRKYQNNKQKNDKKQATDRKQKTDRQETDKKQKSGMSQETDKKNKTGKKQETDKRYKADKSQEIDKRYKADNSQETDKGYKADKKQKTGNRQEIYKKEAVNGKDNRIHLDMNEVQEKKGIRDKKKMQETKNQIQHQSLMQQPSASLMCPVEKKCGACNYLSVDYDKQLKKKQQDLEQLLRPFGKVEGIIGMENPYHYRHKVHAVFDRDRKGNILAGAYQENTHQVVSTEGCLIENEKASAIIQTIKKLLPSFRIKTYDEDTGYGLLRHVLIRVGHATGQIMVILVLGSPILPSKNNFVKALRKEHPEISTVVVNVNDRKTSMVLGEKEQVIYGPGYIQDRLCGLTFKISPKSFYQVNPEQTEKLYRKAMEYAGLTGKEKVLDAYCGTGTIGMVAARQAQSVIGVELNKDAVKDAIINAKQNDIHNIRFYNRDAGEFMVELADKQEKVDVVFMDPPRSGSDEKFLSSLVKLQPDRVVYVSCNPETLARDLKYLTKKGYEMKRAVGVDLFPMTVHVETVVLLSQQKADDHIEIEINLDEIDATSAETKATYAEIRDWVQEKYGFHVTNLNIAKVKQKHGINERENYNEAKSENSRQPGCTEEKAKAIEDAMKHFQMI